MSEQKKIKTSLTLSRRQTLTALGAAGASLMMPQVARFAHAGSHGGPITLGTLIHYLGPDLIPPKQLLKAAATTQCKMAGR